MLIIQTKTVEKKLSTNDEKYSRRLQEICSIIRDKESIADFDDIKGLGFKQYTGTTGKTPIYGFDIGKVKSSHLQPDRLICAFASASDLKVFPQILNRNNEKMLVF